MATAFDTFSDTARDAPIAAAVVLGSGANVVADRVAAIAGVGFHDVPGLCGTSVAGHRDA